MATTDTKEIAKKSNVIEDLTKLPNKVWGEFKEFNLMKKVFLVGCIYFVIENLTKNLSLSKEDITENIIELPKKIWNNFWTAPTGKKFMLLIASWYVVKNLFPSEESTSQNGFSKN
jgi:hypothetical protein